MTSLAAPPPGSYVHWGAIQISTTNLVVILVMVVVFVLAVTIPFGRKHDRSDDRDRS